MSGLWSSRTSRTTNTLYTANGQTITVRTATAGTSGTKLSFLAADHHGTSSVALDADTYAITKRYTTPFGAPRGSKPATWPDDKAFLGKPADTSTGLTHIGARQYDPATGQFVSVDPVLDPAKHQSINGYSYAGNNPVSFADPTGLDYGCGGGTCEYKDDGSSGGLDDGKEAGGPSAPRKQGGTHNGSGNRGGGHGGGQDGGYSGSYEEERRNTDAELARELADRRMAQIMNGDFGIKEGIDESGDAVKWACKANDLGGRSSNCGMQEAAHELKLWNEVKKAVIRIDESWADAGTRKENGG